jgi:hypothetical protein
LRERAELVMTLRRICDRIDVGVVRGDPTTGAGLVRFALMWGSAVTALAHELDLLGVELRKSAVDVVTVDQAGVR